MKTEKEVKPIRESSSHTHGAYSQKNASSNTSPKGNSPVQRRQEEINNNPEVQRHTKLQAKADNSPQVQRLTQLKSKADNSTHIQKKVVQMVAANGLLHALQDQLSYVRPNVDFDAIITEIRGASVAERQLAIKDSALRTRISERLDGQQSSQIMSELMVGSQSWKNPTGNDFYEYFVTNKGTGQLPVTATMNCWESIMYAAYLAGQISAAWIATFYKNALSKGGDPNVHIWADLGWTSSSTEYDTTTGNVPTAGQLVYYTGKGASYPGHIAVAVSSTEVISLWSQPNKIHEVQRIPITDLSGTIQYTNTPW